MGVFQKGPPRNLPTCFIRKAIVRHRHPGLEWPISVIEENKAINSKRNKVFLL